MSTTPEAEAPYLDTFPEWLKALANDAVELGDVLATDGVSAEARETIAGGLNYLFKSLDLIPDEIDDIGYLDDAFVLRVASDLASRDSDSSRSEIVRRLAGECEVIRKFLQQDYGRLESYVVGLRRGAARGRSVSEILENESVRSEFLSEVKSFAASYDSPSFAREEKNLIKLRAFFDAKLPR